MSWLAQGKITGPYADLVRRSALVLKGLSNAPTGAIAAAATTSLPEAPGSIRNWDYRFSWIRDSVFTTRSLAALGFYNEADGFRRFVERSAAGSAEELQVLFGVGGERLLHEHELNRLDGYRGSRPVRIGNAAASQQQHDMYGELLDNAWRWHQGGQSPDDDYWQFLVEIVNSACRAWRLPDRGIWEMRGRPRHFVHSKAMCWSAINRGILLARELGRQAPLTDWETGTGRDQQDDRRATAMTGGGAYSSRNSIGRHWTPHFSCSRYPVSCRSTMNGWSGQPMLSGLNWKKMDCCCAMLAAVTNWRGGKGCFSPVLSGWPNAWPGREGGLRRRIFSPGRLPPATISACSPRSLT